MTGVTFQLTIKEAGETEMQPGEWTLTENLERQVGLLMLYGEHNDKTGALGGGIYFEEFKHALFYNKLSKPWIRLWICQLNFKTI